MRAVWAEGLDEDSGFPYYINNFTGESRWDCPWADLVRSSAPPEVTEFAAAAGLTAATAQATQAKDKEMRQIDAELVATERRLQAELAVAISRLQAELNVVTAKPDTMDGMLACFSNIANQYEASLATAAEEKKMSVQERKLKGLWADADGDVAGHSTALELERGRQLALVAEAKRRKEVASLRKKVREIEASLEAHRAKAGAARHDAEVRFRAITGSQLRAMDATRALAARAKSRVAEAHSAADDGAAGGGGGGGGDADSGTPGGGAAPSGAWLPVLDPSSGLFYYVNDVTGESQVRCFSFVCVCRWVVWGVLPAAVAAAAAD